jgi:hypothetical protein
MLVVSLFGCLQVLLPESSKEELQSFYNSLARTIIIPAIELNEKFNISSTLFGFFSHGVPDGHHSTGLELDIYDFKDLHDSGRAVRAIQEGFQYHYITDISQGLFSCTIKGDMKSTKKYLKKAQVLLAVQKPSKSYTMQKDTALGHIQKCIEAHRKEHALEMAKVDIKAKREKSIFGRIFNE